MAKTTFHCELLDAPIVESGILPMDEGRQFLVHSTYGEKPILVVVESVRDELSPAKLLERVVVLRPVEPKGPSK
jgi:hypothetical protein